MKKRLAGLFCVLALLLALLPSAAGAETMYFMAVNDTMVEYSKDRLPVIISGTVYVPYTMFLSEYNGGVKLGVFYGWDGARNSLSLYSQTKPILTFDIEAGTAYTKDETYSFKAFMRNGMIYLPAWAVCDYFDLTYSYLPNSFGVLIRIKREGSYYLTDRNFVSCATDKFRDQKKEFERSQVVEPTATPTPAPTPTPTPPPSDQRQVRVSFAFRCGEGQGPEALLDSLGRYGVKGVFFFRSEELAGWDDQIRRLLAEGHRVGLIVDGADAAACEEQAEQGNRLLSRIACARTDFLLVDGPDKLRRELSELGWACWWYNIDGVPAPDARTASHTATLLLNIEAKQSLARILMDDSAVSAGALERLLPRLTGKGYLLWTVTEAQL